MFCSNKKTLSYIGLLFVVFVWGTAPLVTLHFYKYYSPSIRLFFSEVILLATYLIISAKHLNKFTIKYIKAGVPTGLFLALANVTQKIGLMYSTPARYAFLENLSCITVPVVMYFLVKKKPNFITILSCVVCLTGIFILNGVSVSNSSWGIGEILCAISGLLYGFNIAGTSVFAKKLYAPLYLAVQSTVGILVALIFALALNSIMIPSASGDLIPIEKIYFSFNPEHIIFTIVYVVVASGLCWIIRTNSMKHIGPTTVAIIMPFSAVVTAILSVIVGNDIFSFNLLVGGIIVIISMITSSFADIKHGE